MYLQAVKIKALSEYKSNARSIYLFAPLTTFYVLIAHIEVYLKDNIMSIAPPLRNSVDDYLETSPTNAPYKYDWR